MTYLEILRTHNFVTYFDYTIPSIDNNKTTTNGFSIDDFAGKKHCLDNAIAEKISQLEDDLKTYPGLFFALPGIASVNDKNAKILALENLQNRIKNSKHKMDIEGYSVDVLDGDTLELFKFASQIYSYNFTREERENIESRNPDNRLSLCRMAGF